MIFIVKEDPRLVWQQNQLLTLASHHWRRISIELSGERLLHLMRSVRNSVRNYNKCIQKALSYFHSAFMYFQSVTSAKSPPKPAKKQLDQSSCSSLVDLLHFKSSSEQTPRSTPSSSRRSSAGQNSTKPQSPASLRKRAGASSDVVICHSRQSPLIGTKLTK